LVVNKGRVLVGSHDVHEVLPAPEQVRHDESQSKQV
jgi:hypothetical protein